MPNTYDLEIIQNNNLNLLLTAKDGAGNPLDLTNFSVRGQVREKYSSSGVLLDLNPSVVNPLSGTVLLNVSGFYTANLPVGTWVYDLAAILSGTITGGIQGHQYETKFLKGYCFCSPDVTR